MAGMVVYFSLPAGPRVRWVGVGGALFFSVGRDHTGWPLVPADKGGLGCPQSCHYFTGVYLIIMSDRCISKYKSNY